MCYINIIDLWYDFTYFHYYRTLEQTKTFWNVHCIPLDLFFNTPFLTQLYILLLSYKDLLVYFITVMYHENLYEQIFFHLTILLLVKHKLLTVRLKLVLLFVFWLSIHINIILRVVVTHIKKTNQMFQEHYYNSILY